MSMSKPVLLNHAELYSAAGLQNVGSTTFQKRNLLIGKNGAGKSRFLRARREDLQKEQRTGVSILWLDFSTQTHSEVNIEKTKSGNLPQLYDILFENESFDCIDFLRLTEQGYENAIEDLFVLLTIRSRNTQNAAKNNIERINQWLFDLVGCQIRLKGEKQHGNDKNILIVKLDKNGKIVRQLPYKEMIKEFSPGERFIFLLCFLMFFSVMVKDRKLILIMDEPELHLHPQILLKIVRWLYENEAVEELWIASHSLFLVPLFQFKELVFFENSVIAARSSQTYRRLYDDLIGLNDIDLFEFLKSLDNWEYYRFILECFYLPVPVNKADPKDEQFQKFIKALPKKDNPLHVLDYGAGQCRIWDCLEIIKLKNAVGPDRMLYEAYEPHPEDGLERKAENAPFILYKEAFEIPKEHYDAVILMNVLHEIDVLEWEKTFRFIRDILNGDGVLIFLEVQTLALGEQPYGNTGYLILGEQEVQQMFPDCTSITLKSSDKSNCWIITKNALNNVNSKAIEDCIHSLSKRSYSILSESYDEKLRNAHEGKKSNKAELSARKYAFWSQQYINALLAQERLENVGRPVQTRKTIASESSKIPYPGLKF